MFRKIFLSLASIVAIFFIALFIAMSIFDSPTYAWRILRYGESSINDVHIFSERVIKNGVTYSPIERDHVGTPYEVEYRFQGEARKEILDDLLKRTGTRVFFIIKEDKLIFETYLDSPRKEVNTSLSTVKSFSSALIGAAIADGKVGSVNDPVIQYIPEISGRGPSRC